MRIVRVLLSTVLGAVAGLAFGPVFGGVPALFGAAVAAVSVVAALAALAAALSSRMPPTAVAVAGAAAVLVTAMAVTGTGTDLVHGPWQLLTGAVPAEPAGPALAAVVVLAGWSTLAAGLLGAYATRPLAALAPPLACLVVALAVGASGPPLPTWHALAVLTLIVALLVAWRPVPPSPAVLGAAAVTAAATITVAAVLGPSAPGLGRPPADARDLAPGPVQPRSGVSPLQQYLALRNGTRLLRLTGTVSRPGSLLRMATLTRFDGVYWTVDGDYRRAGTALPQGRPAAGGGVAAGGRTLAFVTQQVRVEAGQLDWLLTAGRPTRVSVPGLGVDEDTGDLAVPVEATPPDTYTASSVVTTARFDEILAADPVPASSAATLPPQIQSFLDTAVSGQPPGSDQLLALYRSLTVEGGFQYDQSADAKGGHGYFQIQRLLDENLGTSEQYASAYAVMARRLGYDARVVMGFRPQYDREAFVASGQHVDAWVEVNFAGLGWISIDPSPRGNPIGTRPNAPPALSRSTPLDDPLRNAAQTPPPRPPDPVVEDSGPDTAAASDTGGGSAVLPLIGGAVAVLLLVLATPAAKAVRRARRRRAPSDRLAVLGAWRETLDRLREAGMRVLPGQTTGEVVRLHGALIALPALAAAADHAVYAPERPGPAMRAGAWGAAEHVRGQLHARMSLIRRIRALLDPRPLLLPMSGRPPLGRWIGRLCRR